MALTATQPLSSRAALVAHLWNKNQKRRSEMGIIAMVGKQSPAVARAGQARRDGNSDDSAGEATVRGPV